MFDLGCQREDLRGNRRDLEDFCPDRKSPHRERQAEAGCRHSSRRHSRICGIWSDTVRGTELSRLGNFRALEPVGRCKFLAIFEEAALVRAIATPLPQLKLYPSASRIGIGRR